MSVIMNEGYELILADDSHLEMNSGFSEWNRFKRELVGSLILLNELFC